MKQLNLFDNPARRRKLYNKTRSGRTWPCYVTDSQEHVEKHHFDYMYPEKTIFLSKSTHKKLHIFLERMKAKGKPCSIDQQKYILEYWKLNYAEGKPLLEYP